MCSRSRRDSKNGQYGFRFAVASALEGSMAKNSVLLERLAPALFDARARRCLTGAPGTRAFTEFDYQTQKTWSRARRVIGKAEASAAVDNPRFVVTNLPAGGFPDDGEPTRLEPTLLLTVRIRFEPGPTAASSDEPKNVAFSHVPNLPCGFTPDLNTNDQFGNASIFNSQLTGAKEMPAGGAPAAP